MGRAAKMVVVGVVLSLAAVVIESQAESLCYQVNLMETNETSKFSTKGLDEQNDTIIWFQNQQLRIYCWNITFQEDVEIRLNLEVQNGLVDFVNLYVKANGYFSNIKPYYPDQITSTESPTVLRIYIYNDVSYAAFEINEAPDTSDKHCGPSDINLSGEYFLSFSLPFTRIQECTWVITTEPDYIIYVDMLNIELRKSQTLRLGVGPDRGTSRGTTAYAQWDNVTRINGTSFFFREPIWIDFLSLPQIDKIVQRNYSVDILLRSEHGNGEGSCRPDMFLCPRDSMCIPRDMVCDGHAHCSDYLDEVGGCDRCGITDIPLKPDERLTILADFTGYRHDTSNGMHGRFEIYRTSNIPAPDNSAPYFVLVRNYTGHFDPFECAWRLTEPSGSRIRLQVMAFDGFSMILSAGSGHHPFQADLLLEIESSSGMIPPTKEVLSFGDHMWVALRCSYSTSVPHDMKLVFTTYNIADCKKSHYACPSGVGCLANVSQVCDAQKECPFYGDELGCGNCTYRQFSCVSSDVCIPHYHICNGQAECADFSDEKGCGLCGAEDILLHINDTYSLRHGPVFHCFWSIKGEPGTRLRLDLRRLPQFCTVSFGDETFSGHIGTLAALSRPFKYPSVITSRVEAMSVRQECPTSPSNAYPDNLLWVDLSLYVEVECESGEYKCPSGLNCIQETAVCDGRVDCVQHLDEVGCGNCSQTEFACMSGEGCVSTDRICDGETDCLDLSDEFDCAPCGQTFVDFTRDGEMPVTLTSPGWPEINYPFRAQCFWLLVADRSYRIVLTFVEFSTDEDSDYLHCGNGDRFEDPFVTLSGNGHPVLAASRNNSMFVKFTSDEIFSRPGFQLRVEQRIAATVACGEDEIACPIDDLVCVRNDSSINGRQFCPQDGCQKRNFYLQSDNLNFLSPNYPNNYPIHLDCQWKVSHQGVMKVTIEEFATERFRDILWLSGYTVDGGRDMTFQLHGTTKIQAIDFISSSVTISFKTDSTVTFTGFLFVLQPDVFGPDPCTPGSGFNCGDGSCVSTDAQCDGFQDCQKDGKDELDCVNVTCPEFYHCEDSLKCVYWDFVCDGHPDCPHADDESDLECSKRCPEECVCTLDEGRVRVECREGWSESTVSYIVKKTHKLVLSGRNTTISHTGLFKGLSYLRALSISNNNIKQLKPETFAGLENLTVLDISDTDITSIDGEAFSQLKSLSMMLARDIPLRIIRSHGFRGLRQLETLVLIRGNTYSGTPIEVEESAVNDLVRLQDLYVDDHRLCCEFVTAIDGFEATKCVTTEAQPPLNLCGSLMRNHLLRVSMWVLGLSALFGNGLVVLMRLFSKKQNEKWSHTLFVLNLAVSDLMMGIYMLIIAIADLQFGENYFREANEWRSSVACKVAGAISVLSSEASVFFVTMISLDSFFSIVFPFSKIKLGKTSSNVIVALIWTISIGLSAGPTVATGDDSEVYGLSDVCIGLPLLTKPTSFVIEESRVGNSLGDNTIPIPVGKGKQPAWIYSIILFLGVNLVCFLVILACYVAIFISVRKSGSKVRQSSHRDREIKLAVRMAMIVGTDFACWMPVIIMGILSQTGVVDISLDMYAWTVVFILPINSALNPYLYTFNAKLASRKKAQSKASKTLDTDQSNVSQSNL